MRSLNTEMAIESGIITPGKQRSIIIDEVLKSSGNHKSLASLQEFYSTINVKTPFLINSIKHKNNYNNKTKTDPSKPT